MIMLYLKALEGGAIGKGVCFGFRFDAGLEFLVCVCGGPALAYFEAA
jgi:hypothetical protein